MTILLVETFLRLILVNSYFLSLSSLKNCSINLSLSYLISNKNILVIIDSDNCIK